MGLIRKVETRLIASVQIINLIIKINIMNLSDKYMWKYRIESNRLKNYDYGSNGWYFITICTKNRENYFGNIENNKVVLSEFWKIAYVCWLRITDYFSFVILDDFIIMPDHIHWIILIDKDNLSSWDEINPIDIDKKKNLWWFAGKNNVMLNNWLWKIIRLYKWRCTYQINKLNKWFFWWQPNYYDKIIENENSLNKIRKYIFENPLKFGK
jgi:REP element-mobilizing transposase RayT